MKLNSIKERSFGSASIAHEAMEIDATAAGVMMKAFADNIYSDKISSVVREIASNCVDAHTETGQTRPFEVEYEETATGGNLVFRDFGPGISPDRMQRIFKKYFSSTKRDGNEQIGGFGIGSKSPFAYTSIFYIRTVSDGVSYYYELSMGESSPEVALLEKTSTLKENGTEVVIPVKHGDYPNFDKAICSQLLYFDRMLCINIAERMNNREILEGKYFALCNLESLNHVKLLVGDVPYDFPEQLKYVEGSLYIVRSELKGNFRVKIPIGELPVSMSRESVTVSAESQKTIWKYLKLALEELSEKFKQHYEVDRAASEGVDFQKFSELHAYNKLESVRLPHPNAEEDPELNFDPIRFRIGQDGSTQYSKLDELFGEVKLKNTEVRVKHCKNIPSIDILFEPAFYIKSRDFARKKKNIYKFFDPGSSLFFLKKSSGYSKYIDWNIAKHYPDEWVFILRKRIGIRDCIHSEYVRPELVRGLSEAFFNANRKLFRFYEDMEPDAEEREELQKMFGTVNTRKTESGYFSYRPMDYSFVLGPKTDVLFKEFQKNQQKAFRYFYFTQGDRKSFQGWVSTYSRLPGFAIQLKSSKRHVRFCQLNAAMVKIAEETGVIQSWEVLKSQEEASKKQVTINPPSELPGTPEFISNNHYMLKGRLVGEFSLPIVLAQFAARAELNYEINYVNNVDTEHPEILDGFLKPLQKRIRSKLLRYHFKILNQIKRNENTSFLLQSLQLRYFGDL